MEIDDLIGIPYQRGARLPGPATDCYGIVMEVCRRAGRPIPDPFTSSEQPMSAKQWILERMQGWVRCDAPRAGCVVEFHTSVAVAHVGYMLTDQTFLHSASQFGSIISRVDRAPWNARLVGAYVYTG